MKVSLLSLGLLMCILPLSADMLSEATIEKKGKTDCVRQTVSGKTELLLEFRDPGFQGIRLREGGKRASWDLSRYTMLCVDVENRSSTEQSDFHMRIYSAPSRKGEPERTVYSTITLNPGETRTLRLYLPHVVPQKEAIVLNGRLRGAPEGLDLPPNLNTGRILRIAMYMQYPHKSNPGGKGVFRVRNLRGEGTFSGLKGVGSPREFFPFVDAYGQYIHADWKEKVHSDAELKKRFRAETEILKTQPAPSSWNSYGGWKEGPRLRKTGFFRTEKYQGKWYLVDPEGCLFLSNGVNAVQHFDDFRVPNESWYQGKIPESKRLDFVFTNLQKKYSGNVFPRFFERSALRMHAWGLNTIGGWSNPEFYKQRKVPYMPVLFDNGKAPRIGKKFYDPFDPAFAKALDAEMNSPKFKWSLNDPWCAGFFVCNELEFAAHPDLALWTLRESARIPAKKAMTEFFRKKYKEIGVLNSKWKTRYESWADFCENRNPPVMNPTVSRDLCAFSDFLTDEFYRVCRRIVKKNAPNQLYLGSRFNGRCHPDMPWLFRIAAKHADVVSFNSYSNSMGQYMRSDLPDVPCLIGEFSFNVRGRGMFNTDIRCAGVTQEDRAANILRYWQGLLMHPNLVGAHWFTWVDQPLTGRFDGENMTFGLVDVTDTPYPELTETFRRIGENMYTYRLKNQWNAPFEVKTSTEGKIK